MGPIIKVILILLKKYWQYILILLLALALYFMYNAWNKALNEAKRNDQNFKELNESPDKRIEVFTKDQFEDYKGSLLDSIRKYVDKSIKAKNINNVTHVYEYYIDSSTTIYNAPKIGEDLFDISYVDNCWGFDGNINLKDTSVSLTNKWFENDIDIVVYWQRPRWFGSKSRLMPRWLMPKQTFIETIDKCKSEKKVVRTNIIKKD